MGGSGGTHEQIMSSAMDCMAEGQPCSRFASRSKSVSMNWGILFVGVFIARAYSNWGSILGPLSFGNSTRSLNNW